MAFLLRATTGHHSDGSPAFWRPQTRSGSPWPGGSILTTSAPRSASRRVQCGPAMVVVKSTNHFYDSFSALAAEIIHVATPGALSYDFANLPYRKRNSRFWPRIPQPWD